MQAAQSKRPGRLSLKRFFQGEGPEAHSIFLSQRRVYILPSKMGVYFGAMMLVMLLGAINYNNNLGFALTFLLASICIVGILHTYRNLLHLRVDVGPIPSVFCGDTVNVPVILDNKHYAARYEVQVYFPQQKKRLDSLPPSSKIEAITDIVADHWQRTDVPLTTQQRGQHLLPRFCLRSIFPLGLFQVWAYAQRDVHYLVHPTPDPQHSLPNEINAHLNLTGDRGRGADDFAGLRTYHNGDSLRHVHWKAVAREQGMHIKQFGGDQNDELWLDWDSLQGLDTETRLSRLCRWVLDADTAQLNYGLHLPGNTVPVGTGLSHQHRCLKALAMHHD